MQDTATASDFTDLDSIFSTHSNSKDIQQMQQKVVDYEQALQRQAELLLQQKFIQEEQEKLKKAFGEIMNLMHMIINSIYLRVYVQDLLALLHPRGNKCYSFLPP